MLGWGVHRYYTHKNQTKATIDRTIGYFQTMTALHHLQNRDFVFLNQPIKTRSTTRLTMTNGYFQPIISLQNLQNPDFVFLDRPTMTQSVDRFHRHHKKIYRVLSADRHPDSKQLTKRKKLQDNVTQTKVQTASQVENAPLSGTSKLPNEKKEETSQDGKNLENTLLSDTGTDVDENANPSDTGIVLESDVHVELAEQGIVKVIKDANATVSGSSDTGAKTSVENENEIPSDVPVDEDANPIDTVTVVDSGVPVENENKHNDTDAEHVELTEQNKSSMNETTDANANTENKESQPNVVVGVETVPVENVPMSSLVDTVPAPVQPPPSQKIQAQSYAQVVIGQKI